MALVALATAPGFNETAGLIPEGPATTEVSEESDPTAGGAGSCFLAPRPLLDTFFVSSLGIDATSAVDTLDTKAAFDVAFLAFLAALRDKGAAL